jgi:hypothetical protein
LFQGVATGMNDSSENQPRRNEEDEEKQKKSSRPSCLRG